MTYGRRAGVFAHVSSLPGKYAIGDLGDALEFVRMISRHGMTAWQILPIAPTDPACGCSPYSSASSFAGNALFISPDMLLEDGLITAELAARYETPQSDRVDFETAARHKKEIIDAAYEAFRADDAYETKYREISDLFWHFCYDRSWWLEDYALYRVLKEIEGGLPWNEWRPEFKHREWSVLDELKSRPDVARDLDRIRFEQFLFFRQMTALHDECRELGVIIIGDMPIYASEDSADVWGHQELFDLDDDGRCVNVAGVPPDYFSKTGQRWGNPLYRWDVMARDGYAWWMGRIEHALRTVDVLRIDHFRGIMAYWAIPAEEETAINGEWKDGPGRDLLRRLRDTFAAIGPMPFIAEDLGIITDDVREAMDDFLLPGMKVLHFAFGADMPQNPYAPHNHARNSVVYAGTHDNDTTLGWWTEDATEEEKLNFERYARRPRIAPVDVPRAMIEMVLSSVANTAIITAQDILCLGSKARMNTPSTPTGNWTWRLTFGERLSENLELLKHLAVMYGRYKDDPTDVSKTEEV